MMSSDTSCQKKIDSALWQIHYLLSDMVLNDASNYTEARAYQLELIAKKISDISHTSKNEVDE